MVWGKHLQMGFKLKTDSWHLGSINKVGQLNNLLIQYHLVRGETEKVLWCSRSDFAVKTLMHKEFILISQEVKIDNLVCTVWMNITPSKVEFMLWLALLGMLKKAAPGQERNHTCKWKFLLFLLLPHRRFGSLAAPLPHLMEHMAKLIIRPQISNSKTL